MSSVTTEAALKENPESSPWIGRFTADDVAPCHYIFVESQTLCQVQSFTKALLLWLSSHLEYPKYYRDAAICISQFILDIATDVKWSANYLSISTDISNIKDKCEDGD